jgi:hypothetical protein
MDLIAVHGNKVAAPINASPHNLLFLFKEATGLTIIPSPTVQYSLMEVIDKVNSTAAPPEASRQRDINSSTPVAIQATAAAAATTLANKLAAAKATVTHATAQKDLSRSISLQAQTIAEESACGCKQACLALDKLDVQNPPLLTQSKLLKPVALCEMDKKATEKGHIAYGANAFNDRAHEKHKAAVKVLDNLCKKMTSNGDGGPSNGWSLSSHGTMTTPHSTSTLSSISVLGRQANLKELLKSKELAT